MPERTTKSGERCELHPGRASVGNCDACGRGICLTCAVPVRGQVLCPDCLVEAIGPEAISPPPEERRQRRPAVLACVLALAAALLSTLLPWTRFGGVGSWSFGAWSWPLRWSVLSAAAAAAGVVFWVVGGLRASRRTQAAVLAASACLVSAGAALALLRPPANTDATLAPWFALSAGVVGLLAGIWAARSPVRQRI
ncbi:MAG TPA: hypothetical protein VJN50_00045 [Actinomycetota bacterium]|nr:hypothetical protein [Actinomycetota bacterium]